ncbi:MAG: glycerophosphodiester phosphodiesterase [Clostridia bacterium]|nr:glycerophosphodiester phosphodiesterase [Clostridia bacterium]
MKDTKSTTILPSGFTITAHAGALDTEANTLDSVRVCLENADIAEIDLRFLPDGTPVLSHNSPSADAARLEDAFRLLKQFPDKRMNVDVKATTDMPLVQKLAEEIGVLPQVFFTGVVKRFVAAVRAGAPKIPYYLNVDLIPLFSSGKAYANHLVHLVQLNGAIGLNCNYGCATSTIVQACHRHGLLVSLWTARSEDAANKILSLGADNLTTTMPDKVRKMASAGD